LWQRPVPPLARLAVVSLFNLPLQAFLLLMKYVTPAGAFATRALPALLFGLVLIVATAIAFVTLEPGLSPKLLQLLRRNPARARAMGRTLIAAAAAVLLFS